MAKDYPKYKNQFLIKNQNTVNLDVEYNEDNRLKKFHYRYCMLNDNFYDQVISEMGNIYEAAMELGLITQIDDTNNLFKMVMEEISKVYKEEPVRKFDESAQDEMDTYYKLIKVTNVLKQSNLYMNSFNDCLIQVGVDNDDIKLRLRRPDNTVVTYDDDMNLTFVAIYICKGKEVNKHIWRCYTNEEIYEIEVEQGQWLLDNQPIEEDKKQLIDGSSDMKNPYGFIPFLPIHNSYRDDSFWQKYKGDDIVKGTIQVAVKLTFLNHLIKLQSFKQLIAKGSNLKSLNDVVIDPQTILFLDGQDTDIEALDLTADYKQLWETIEAINNNLARNYKLSTNFFRMTGNVSSGFALKMENIRLDSFITDQQKEYVDIEIELFDLMKRVDEAVSLGKIKGNPPKVTFSKATYPKTDKEVLDEKEKRIALGYEKPTDTIKEERGVDDEEATKIFNENLAERNQLNQKFNQSPLNLETTQNALNNANED